MSTDTAVHGDSHTAHAGGHSHPGDKQYVVVALILGLFTALEVMTYFKSFVDFGDAAIPMLLVLMVAKFALVVLFFMHLKFDSPVFMRLFVAGLILAVGVYMVMLSAFEFWS